MGKRKDKIPDYSNVAGMTDKKKSVKEKISEIWAVHKKELLIGVCLFVSILNFIYMFLELAISMVDLNYSRIITNPIYNIIVIVFPVVLFVISTDTKFYDIRRRKWRFVLYCIFNTALVIMRYMFEAFALNVMHYVFRTKVDGVIFTEGMVVNLGRYIMFYIMLAIGYILYANVFRYLLLDNVKANILAFKLKHYIDDRTEPEYKYDMDIIKDLETGESLVVTERDRYTHATVNGATGTGKTSSIIKPAVYYDLVKRRKNHKELNRRLYKMVAEGRADLVNSYVGDKVLPHNVVPKADNEKAIKEYKYILDNFRGCGITVVAPNDDLTYEIAKMCRKMGVDFNVIDATITMGSSDNEYNYMAFNPLKMPVGVSENDEPVEVAKRATMFSDVIERVNEMKGSGDQFFTGINRDCTTNIALVCILGIPLVHKGRDADVRDLQACLNDFTKLKPYVTAIEEHYDKKFGKDKNPYRDKCDYIKSHLLGYDAEKVFEHSLGLRNLINEIMMLPNVRSVFIGENSIDLDKMLSEGQVTIVNYGTDNGENASTTFGLTFLLSFFQAVYRRPGDANTRIPHLLVVDEFANLLDPSFQRAFTYARQFGLMMMVAFQNLSQFDKTPVTKFIKNIITGAGCFIQFGRASAEEMEFISKLSGMKKEETVQKQVTQTSMLDETTSYSVGERYQVEEVANIDETAVRFRDFQEVTVIRTRNGRVEPVRIGRVDFLPRNAFDVVSDEEVDWSLLQKERPEEVENGTENIKNEIEKEEISSRVESDIDELEIMPITEAESNHVVSSVINSVEPVSDTTGVQEGVHEVTMESFDEGFAEDELMEI